MIRSHADMQSEHYRAVRTSPMYVAEALADIMREELSMSMPYPTEVLSYPKEIQPEPEWSKRQWDKVQQLEAEVLHYRQEIAEYTAKVDKLIASKKGKTTDYDVDDIVTTVTNRHAIVTDRHK